MISLLSPYSYAFMCALKSDTVVVLAVLPKNPRCYRENGDKLLGRLLTRCE